MTDPTSPSAQHPKRSTLHATRSTDSPLPLAGYRVLDLTRALAGPYCTGLLGDLGAEIVKIEEPDVGDEAPHWGPPFFGGESAYFLSMNRHKQSVAVNLKTDEGRQICLRLA